MSILERKDIIVDTVFCLDEPAITESIQELNNNRWLKKVTGATPINTCVNSVTEKVGLMTVEDYAYALNGTTLNYQGNNFLSDDSLTWTMTPYKGATKDGLTNAKHMWVIWYNNPSYLTVSTGLNNEGISAGAYDFSIVDSYGLSVRPVISIKDDVLIKNGDGTKINPYVLITEQELKQGNTLNNAKVGQYVYLDESNNPYTFPNETVLTGITYNTTKDKVRYRIVKINIDETVKLERADILRDLPDTVALRDGNTLPYYYKIGDSIENSCFTDINGEYFDKVSGKVYASGCVNHNIFNPEEGTGDYNYLESENIGYFLNNASNSFYNWYSDNTKEMILESEWKLPVGAHEKNYKTSLYNEDEITTYPNTTTDGIITAYIGLPQDGEIYSGNDINVNYWYINRYIGSNSSASYVDHAGHINGNVISDRLFAIRPVIRLKSTVKIQSGEGTISNPYSLTN